MLGKILIGAFLISIVTCRNVNFQTDGNCGETIIVSKTDSLFLSSNGGISNGNCTVVIKPDSELQTTCKYYPICIQPMDFMTFDRQCFAALKIKASLTNGKTAEWNIGCGQKTGYDPRCYDASSVRVVLMESDKQYVPYNFRFSAFAKCQDTASPSKNEGKYTLIKGYSSDGTLPGHDDIEFKNLAEEVHADRIVGIVVAVCLATVFLVVMVVTYFYYKNKAYSSVPKA